MDPAGFDSRPHAIVTEGLLRSSTTLYCQPKMRPKELEKTFGSKVVAISKGEGKIDIWLIEKLTGWRQCGSVFMSKTALQEMIEITNRP